MKPNTTEVQIRISCLNPELAEIVIKGLEPENSLLDDDTKILMKREGKNVVIDIESVSKIASIRYTIDDILNTISTIEKLYIATNQFEK